MKKDKRLQIWVSNEVKEKLEEKATKYSFSSLSEFMIFSAMNVEIKASIMNTIKSTQNNLEATILYLEFLLSSMPLNDARRESTIKMIDILKNEKEALLNS